VQCRTQVLVVHREGVLFILLVASQADTRSNRMWV